MVKLKHGQAMQKQVIAALVAAILPMLTTAQQAPLLLGLKLKDFVATFNRHAKFDGEPTLTLQGCKESPIPTNKTRRVFQCTTAGFVHLNGITHTSGTLQDVTVGGQPGSTEEIHRFRRAAQYLARAVKDTRGEGQMVMELLASASRAPGTVASNVDAGVRFSAHKDPDLGWSFGAERPQ